jgi:hypothetical protein
MFMGLSVAPLESRTQGQSTFCDTKILDGQIHDMTVSPAFGAAWSKGRK